MDCHAILPNARGAGTCDEPLRMYAWQANMTAALITLQTVLRIWDCLFYEGSKVILRVSLTLLSLHKEELLVCQDFAQLVTAMKVCKGNITALLVN